MSLASKICGFHQQARNITLRKKIFYSEFFWSVFGRGVVVINVAQLNSTKPELRFNAGSSPGCGVPEIRDGEDL